MAFVVVCRDICNVSETFARCCRSSLVDIVRCASETIGSVEECGSSSSVLSISGRSVSMSSRSGMIGRGPEKEAVREVSVRDWCVRCVVRASCAVFSLAYC